MIEASPTLVDLIINHPSVRPTADCCEGVLRSRELFERGAVAYAEEEGFGCALFVPIGGDVWQGHIFIVEGGRGAAGLALGREALNCLFRGRLARKVVAAVPLALPAARFYCRRLGLKPVGRDDLVENFVLEIEQWAAS